jgi:uncharacterized protein YecA (UPF0149 family)
MPKPNDRESRETAHDEAFVRGMLMFPDPLPFEPWSDELSREQRKQLADWRTRAEVDREFL